MGIRLRQGTSGKELVGDSDNNSVVWDDTAKDWVAAPGTGGSITPLSKVLVVEHGGGNVDGSFSGNKAFSTLAAAIAAATDDTTILLMPGDYTAEGALTWASKSLGFSSLAVLPGDVILPALTATVAGNISLEGVTAHNITAPGTVRVHQTTQSGVITATNINVSNSGSSAGVQYAGIVNIDLMSYNAFAAATGTWAGASFNIVDSKPFNNEFYVNQGGYLYGNGSPGAPFKTLREAIVAAPVKTVSAATIFIPPGDYTAEGPIAYTDKRLSIQGTQLLNESPAVPTAGVTLRPTSSDNSNLVLELIRTNSNVIPQSQGIIVLMQDAHCEAVSDGVHLGTWKMIGASGITNVMGSEGTLIGACFGNNYNLSTSLFSDHVEMQSGIVNGALTMSNVSTTSTFVQSQIQASITCSGVLNIYDCTFLNTGSPINLIGGTALNTDLATYARGINAGVTWPANVNIVDTNVNQQPAYFASGAGSNSNTNPTPGLPTNLAGDLFICVVNAQGGTPPTLPVGWSLVHQKINGIQTSQVWTRNTRSTGGEVGTILVTGGGGTPTSAIIHSFRFVAAGTNPVTFTESVVDGTAAGAGPTTVGGPTVVAAGSGRTAVTCTFSNGTATGVTTIAGNTGGTWVDEPTSQFSSGLGSCVDLQHASMLPSGTITGGTYTSPGTNVSTISFALIGAVAN